MKKIITFSSLVICVSLIVTFFASCNGNKKNDETSETTEYIASVLNGEFSFSAEVGENDTVIKNNGEVYQTLKYPVNSGITFDYAYAKEHAQFIDMNFDGQPDFYIAVSAEGETVYFYCWLFNSTTKQFDYSVSLSGLTNISVDSEKQLIYSTLSYNGETKIATYRWVDGRLTSDTVYDSVSDTIPAEVTQGAKENAIGTVTRPALTTSKPKPKPTEDNKKNTDKNVSASTTSGNGGGSASATAEATTRPLNTTTTSPRDGSIKVETGDINEGWF